MVLAEEVQRIILRLSNSGMRMDLISKICDATVEEVFMILAQAGALDAVVKRLTTDPPELCCVVTQTLFQTPVIAADGQTYERESIERWFSQQRSASALLTSPLTGIPLQTDFLYPDQNTVARVSSFKEETVAEILSIARLLEKVAAVENLNFLLPRAEGFLRAQCHDFSARKKLLRLLCIWMRLPSGDGEALEHRLAVIRAKHEVHKVFNTASPEELFVLLGDMDELELCPLVPTIHRNTLEKLHVKLSGSQMMCKNWIDRELACRLVPLLGHDHCFWQLWQMCSENAATQQNGQKAQWINAAACLLAVFHERLYVLSSSFRMNVLGPLGSEVLAQSCLFLESRNSTSEFAKSFFRANWKFIDTDAAWPPSSAARVFLEASSRDNVGEERSRLFLRSYDLGRSDTDFLDALFFHIHFLFVNGDHCDIGVDLSEIYLNLVPFQGRIPDEVLTKLTVEDSYLARFQGDLAHLMVRLFELGRSADAGRAAEAMFPLLRDIWDPFANVED